MRDLEETHGPARRRRRARCRAAIDAALALKSGDASGDLRIRLDDQRSTPRYLGDRPLKWRILVGVELRHRSTKRRTLRCQCALSFPSGLIFFLNCAYVPLSTGDLLGIGSQLSKKVLIGACLFSNTLLHVLLD